MNILEALKSGKRFKRQAWLDWYHTAVQEQFSTDDVLADDWEVEEVKVTITAAEFDQARHRVSVRLYRVPTQQVHICDFLNELKKELGL